MVIKNLDNRYAVGIGWYRFLNYARYVVCAMKNRLPQDSLVYFPKGMPEEQIAISSFYRKGSPDSCYWLHFSIDNPAACDWLREKSGIDPACIDSMLSRKVRPRVIEGQDFLLLILRVADTIDLSEHEELRSLRIYVDQSRLISASLYPLPVVKKMMKNGLSDDKEDAAPRLFLDLTIQSVRGLEAILEDLDEQADALERLVIGGSEDPDDGDIANLALDSLELRRCLGPQKGVLAQLADSEVTWLKPGQKKRLRDCHERISRQLDEVMLIRDRARIVREQCNSHVAEQANKRLYIFSLSAVVFLPLSFVTGLLGVNLAGIPGAEHPLSFLSLCGMLTVFVLGMMLTLKWLRWL